MNDLSVKKGELSGEMSTLREEMQQYSNITLLKNKSEEELKEAIKEL